MSKYPQPDREGFYWGKLVHPAEGTDDGDEAKSMHWEVMDVYEDTKELRVFVPGVRKTQNIEDFIWGPRVADFTPAFDVPPVPADPKRKHGYTVNLTEQEMDALEALAKEHDLPPWRVLLQGLRLYQYMAHPVDLGPMLDPSVETERMSP